jgi:hypothetical protein
MKQIRYYVSALAVLGLLCCAAQAGASVGWAGNVYPNNGAVVVPTGSVTVYAQVWKGGTTDPPGQGADVSAELRYTTNIGTQVNVPMVYQGDVGNNDEYKGDVPQSALAGAAYVDVTVVFTDLTDMSTFEVTGDQQGHAPPLRYNVTNVLPNDVAVKFTLCMSGTGTNGAPCVIGSAPQIGTWGSGVSMTQVSGDLYEVTVVFAGGSSPYFEYKYKSDGCNNWEGVGNRLVTLPTDGTTTVNLNPDSFNNAPLGCNLGQTLSSPKEVCFQVCTDVGGGPVGTGLCVIGSSAQLTNWSTGVAMTEIAPNLFQACVTYPAGTPLQTVEYKFKKDDCNTWESVGNRMLTIDNGTPSSQTLTNSWENGTGACAAVGTHRASWGKLKMLYR